jgi:cell division protein FtsQ
MPRKNDNKKRRETRIFTPRYIVRVVLAGAVLVAGLYAWNRTEQFLINDPRFAMAIPDYGLESTSLHISGAQYASRAQIVRVFAPDFGRSVYLLPLRQRREQLRSLDWIKEASISRIWPNRILVRILEREPVAFLQESAGKTSLSRVALIDDEGAILQPPAHARFNLPVALGIRSTAPAQDRIFRVSRVTALMKDAGPLGDRVSEVDVTEPDNLKVTARAGDRAVTLMLGDHNFAKRIQNFINNYPKIQERLSGATMLDMRLEDRITVAGGGDGKQ